MSTVVSSMSEILRVGGWALRGIGYPFGVAERGVRLLAWTEATGGKAIAKLRLEEAAVERSHSAAACERAGDPGSGRTVHAKGRHLLEIGAPAVDLVTHDARRTSAGHVRVDGVFGLGLLPSLANLLAHRKLSGMFVYGAAEADRVPDGWPRTGWLMVQSAARGPVFAHGALEGKGGAALRGALRKTKGARSSRLLSRALEYLSALDALRELGYMGIVAMPGTRPVLQKLIEAMQSHPEAMELVDFQGRIAEALSSGIPIEAEDLDYLYGLELRTWAPTSERSRSQAGYGVY